MNFKTTVILAILVAIGGAAFYLLSGRPAESDSTSTTEPPKPATKFVFDPRPERDQVVKLVFERAGKPRLAFQRSGEKDASGAPEPWRMVEPVAADVDTWTVDGLSTTLIGLQSSRTFKAGEAGVSLKDAGLEPPQASIEVATKDGKSFKLEIGGKAALSADSYVRAAGGDTIAVVNRDFTPDIKKKVNDYRSKSLFRLARNNAARVSGEQEGRSFDLSKGASPDEWVINAPVKAYADAQAVRDLVGALASTKIEEFVEDEPASLEPYGLDKPLVSLSVTTEEKKLIPQSQPTTDSQPVEPKFETTTKTHSLLVGGFADIGQTRRYVKLPDQPWVGSVAKETAEKLIPSFEKLRDRRVTRVKAATATQLELNVGGGTASLKNEAGVWKGSGDLDALDKEAVRQLLEAFEDVKAIAFVDQQTADPKYGLANPRATLKVTVAGSVEPVTLNIGAATPSGLNTYVQVAGSSSIAIVSAEQAKRLAVAPMSLRSREIVSANPTEFRRIEVTKPSGRCELRFEGGAWSLVEPAGAPVDPAGLRDLTNDLARLRAKDVVARDADAQFGLDEPLVRVNFTLEQTPASQPTSDAAGPVAPVRSELALRIGRKDDKTYARREDQPYVFELDETVYRTLTGELIDRNLLRLAAADVQRLKIQSNNGMLEFRRADKKWEYAPDPSVKLNHKKVDEFVAEMAGLRVEQYLQWKDAQVAASTPSDPIVLELGLKDGPAVTIKIDQVKRGELPRRGVWVEPQRSFLLRAADVEKIIRGLDAYLGPEADEKPAPPIPGQPPPPRPPGG